MQINWHDTSIHPEIIIDNTSNFSVGDMTDEIVALASKAEGESLRSLCFYTLNLQNHAVVENNKIENPNE